jgi:hypothetical protein
MSGELDEYALQRQLDNVLVAAFNESDQWFQRRDAGYTNTDVVGDAWRKLTPQQQAENMDNLFNGWWHMIMDVRKRLELAGMAPAGNSYLQDGDLDIIEDTLSGAAMLSAEPLDEVFPDGMLTIHIEVLQRLISELGLLQHRLAMATQAGRADNTEPAT